MAVDMAVRPLPCTQAEYEHFKAIHEGFCFLIDNKNMPSVSTYSYRQTEVYLDLVDFWPVIESICQQLNIGLTIKLSDIECIFSGFDAESIAALYKHERYVGIARKKIQPMEEYRLFQVTKTLFDTLMARLRRTFRKHKRTGDVANIEPLKDDLQDMFVADEELTNEQAVELLGGGISRGTISKWVNSGLLRDNGYSGRNRRVIKSSVLLLKDKRDKEREHREVEDIHRVEAARKQPIVLGR
jgi:hypothetical protein